MTFSELANEDRIWIFPGGTEIEKAFQKELLNELNSFLIQWKAHGKELKSYLTIAENRFVIIAVDESFEQASGCSIDTMVHFIQSLEKKYNLNLTDRSQVFYQNDSEGVRSTVFNKISELVENGEIHESTKIYNTHVSKGETLKNGWILNAKDSWIQRYFSKSTV